MPKRYFFEGTAFILGSNSNENWEILQNADEEDTWVHLHNHPSPYVIIKKEAICKRDLEYAGHLCKSHSKLRDVKNVQMSSLKVAYVVKGRQSGQAMLLRAPDVKSIR